MLKNEILNVGMKDIISFECSSDGKLLGCLGRHTLGHYYITILNLKTGKQISSDLYHKFATILFSFSPNNKILITAAQDSKLRIWNLRQGKQLGFIYFAPLTPESVCFSPDGLFVAYAYWDFIIRICKITNRGDFETLEGHISFVLSVCYTAKGNMLISCSEDKSIRMWNTNTYKLIWRYNINSMDMNIQVSPKNLLFISSQYDGIRIQDSKRKKQIAHIKQLTDKFLQTTDGNLVLYLSNPVNAGYPIYDLNIMTRAHGLLIPREIVDDYHWTDLGIVRQIQLSRDGLLLFENKGVIRCKTLQ